MINATTSFSTPDGPRPCFDLQAMLIRTGPHAGMMGWAMLIVFLLGMPFMVCGQLSKSEYERSSIYNLNSIKVVMMEGVSMTGVLVQADTGKLTLKRYKDYTRKFDLISIRYAEIDFIKIRKRGAIGLGVALGGLVGGFVGGALGNAPGTGNSFMKEFSSAAPAMGGVLVGGIVGGVLCGIKGKYQINGNRKLFNDFVLGLEMHKR